jgi:serine/threonine protein kinase
MHEEEHVAIPRFSAPTAQDKNDVAAANAMIDSYNKYSAVGTLDPSTSIAGFDPSALQRIDVLLARIKNSLTDPSIEDELRITHAEVKKEYRRLNEMFPTAGGNMAIIATQASMVTKIENRQPPSAAAWQAQTAERVEEKSKWILFTGKTIIPRPKEYQTIDQMLAKLQQAKYIFAHSKKEDADYIRYHRALQLTYDTVLACMKNPQIPFLHHHIDELEKLQERISAAQYDLVQESEYLKAHYQGINQIVLAWQNISDSELNIYHDNMFGGLNDRDFGSVSIEHIGGAFWSVYLMTAEPAGSEIAVRAIVREVDVSIIDSNQNSIAAVEALTKIGANKHLAQSYYLAPAALYDAATAKVNAYVQIAEYFPRGNLAERAITFTGTVEERQTSALHYLGNLLEIISDCKKSGVFFSDVKPGNLLLDSTDHLVIADIKSLVCVQEQQQTMDIRLLQETSGYLAPERFEPGTMIQTSAQVNIDHSASYMIGAAIYEYAVGNSPDTLVAAQTRNTQNAQPFDFTQPVFQGTKGQLLKEVIAGLICTNPAERMALENAQFYIRNNILPSRLYGDAMGATTFQVFHTITPATASQNSTAPLTKETQRVDKQSTGVYNRETKKPASAAPSSASPQPMKNNHIDERHPEPHKMSRSTRT